jgi:hypothetical protein
MKVSRTRAYKLAHPERVMTHHQTRRERIHEGSDGTASDQAIARLKRRSTHCAYCGEIPALTLLVGTELPVYHPASEEVLCAHRGERHAVFMIRAGKATRCSPSGPPISCVSLLNSRRVYAASCKVVATE